MDQKMINLTIDGIPVTVPQGTTVLEAARQASISIPTLCYLKGVSATGSCRICVVDVGARSLMTACTLAAAEGMVVKTNTPAVREARRMNLELLLSNHDRNCLTCVRNQSCELQALSMELGVDDIPYEGEPAQLPLDLSSTSIVRNPNKCILCRRCVAACADVQKIGVIGPTHRGFDTVVEPAFGRSLADVQCINCGQCIKACPVGALSERDDTAAVWAALADPDKHVVVQTAPATRVGLGEEFGLPLGARVTGKLVAALRRLGFDRVFDTDFSADLTILEEGTELIERIRTGGPLPLITSCSPGWVKYCETFYPEFLPNLSSCKSPQQMMGAIIKTYYAQKMGIDPKKIVSVSIMPCTAKKFESSRPEMGRDGLSDVDYALTTRELARMIRQAGIAFNKLPDEAYDALLGESTGAGVIFGATGGVMEAALRTVFELMTGKPLENLELAPVRGLAGVKEATLRVGDRDVSVAVAHGIGNARKVLDALRSGEKQYDFVEIMACPGGCINGGGQPIVSARDLMEEDPREARTRALYEEERSLPRRKSHENQQVQQLYKDFLGSPGSHEAHGLLHTKYVPREQDLE